MRNPDRFGHIMMLPEGLNSSKLLDHLLRTIQPPIEEALFVIGPASPAAECVGVVPNELRG